MHNRACFWKPFGSDRVNDFQKLLKSTEKNFYPTFSSVLAKLSYKKLILIRSEILELLLNKFTGNYKYSRSNRQNLPLPIEIKISKKHKFFCCIFLAFQEFTLNFQCSKTEKSLIRQVFLKLLTPKDVLI